MSRAATAVNERFAPVRNYFRRHRSLGIAVSVLLISIALPLITRIPPFDGIQSTNAWVNAFTTAAIYAVLAMGLGNGGGIVFGRLHVMHRAGAHDHQ